MKKTIGTIMCMLLIMNGFLVAIPTVISDELPVIFLDDFESYERGSNPDQWDRIIETSTSIIEVIENPDGSGDQVCELSNRAYLEKDVDLGDSHAFAFDLRLERPVGSEDMGALIWQEPSVHNIRHQLE